MRNPHDEPPNVTRRRLDIVCVELGLDRARVKAWCFAHALLVKTEMSCETAGAFTRALTTAAPAMATEEEECVPRGPVVQGVAANRQFRALSKSEKCLAPGMTFPRFRRYCVDKMLTRMLSLLARYVRSELGRVRSRTSFC